MKTAELTGPLLDYWVARAEGWELTQQFTPESGGMWMLHYEKPNERGATGETQYTRKSWRPSEQWFQGGPIIERAAISLHGPTLWGRMPEWLARTPLKPVSHEKDAPCWSMGGPTPLIAAMRCYVASKFGAEVPEVAP